MTDYHIRADMVQRQALCEKFNCCPDTVTKALSYKRNGTKSRAIRTYAVNFLGCILEDDLKKYL